MSKEQWEGRDGSRPGEGAQTYDAQGHVPPHAAGQADPPPAADAGSEPSPRNLDQALDAIDRLREQVAAQTAETERLRDQLLRERAELENFKRRMQR